MRLYLKGVLCACAISVGIVGLSLAGVAFGQEPDPPAVPGRPPVLPGTEVEATRPENDETPFFDDTPMAFPGGSIFDSPIVRGYRADSSTAGTLFDIPDTQLPGTANVITRDLMNDQQALNIGDIVRNAGGVTKVGDGFFADAIFLRGLQAGSRNFRKDGFFDPTFVPRDFQNIERVEILKGPASVLYGAGDPAGLVNLVTKKPLDAQFSNFLFTFGSYNQQRYTTDTNGRVDPSGTILYRVNVAHEDINGFVDFDFMSRTLVAPAVTWVFAPTTTLTWQSEIHNDHRRGFQGTPAINGNPLALPPSRFVGEPGNDFSHMFEFRQTLVLSHELADDWYLRVGGSSLFYQIPASVTNAASNPLAPNFPDATPPDFYRLQNNFTLDNEQSHSVIANVNGKFDTGNVRHNVLVGGEYIYFNSDSAGNFAALNQLPPPVPVFPPFSFPPFDVTNPVYINPPSTTLLSYVAPIFQQQRLGGYVQDYVEFNPNWKLLAGVRFDALNQEFDRTTFTVLATTRAFSDQNFYRLTPRVGLVYQPFEDRNCTLYANYNQSFTPPGGLFLNTINVKPILGELFEFGLKTEVIENLTFNAAAFHVTRQNSDINASAFNITQVGQERSQGAELNLIGSLTERWTAVANYTYADTLITDTPGSPFDGKRSRNVPFNTANLWTRYNLVQDEVRTIGAALGLVYLGSREANISNTQLLPAFSRWDAGLYYAQGRFVANAYFENIFDIQYAASSINEFQIFQGAPRNGRVNAGWTF